MVLRMLTIRQPLKYKVVYVGKYFFGRVVKFVSPKGERLMVQCVCVLSQVSGRDWPL